MRHVQALYNVISLVDATQNDSGRTGVTCCYYTIGAILVLYYSRNLVLYYSSVGTGHFPIRTFPHLTKYELDEDLSARRTIPHWWILAARTIPHSQYLYLFQMFTNSKTLFIYLSPSLSLSLSPCVCVYYK